MCNPRYCNLNSNNKIFIEKNYGNIFISHKLWLIDIEQEISLAYNAFPFGLIRLWSPHLLLVLHLLQGFALPWNHEKYRFHMLKEFPNCSPASQHKYMVPNHIWPCPYSLFAEKVHNLRSADPGQTNLISKHFHHGLIIKILKLDLGRVNTRYPHYTKSCR